MKKKKELMTEADFRARHEPDCFVVALGDETASSFNLAISEARRINRRFNIKLDTKPIDILLVNGERGLGYTFTKTTRP